MCLGAPFWKWHWPVAGSAGSRVSKNMCAETHTFKTVKPEPGLVSRCSKVNFLALQFYCCCKMPPLGKPGESLRNPPPNCFCNFLWIYEHFGRMKSHTYPPQIFLCSGRFRTGGFSHTVCKLQPVRTLGEEWIQLGTLQEQQSGSGVFLSLLPEDPKASEMTSVSS